MTTTSTITVQNKKYAYTISQTKKGVIRFVCKAACIDQDFLAEDIPQLIFDLPELIVAERSHQHTQTEVIRFRISAADKSKIEKKALAEGFDTVSDYLRASVLA